MLTWLEIAFNMEIDVASYLDSAHGIMSEFQDGVYWVSEVILHPTIKYGPRRSATASAEERLHEMAHEQSFIEQSIKTQAAAYDGQKTADIYMGRGPNLPAGYAQRTFQIESGGNPNAQTPSGTYKGLGNSRRPWRRATASTIPTAAIR